MGTRDGYGSNSVLRFSTSTPAPRPASPSAARSTASLIAFLIGIGCIAGALLVGFLTAKTLVDWQAIQFYRAEWLLGATASFVAGILLKKDTPKDSDYSDTPPLPTARRCWFIL